MRGIASAGTLRPGPSAAVRSKSNAAGRPTLHRRPLLHLRRSPEPSLPSIRRSRRLMPPLTAAARATSSVGDAFSELASAADFAGIASPDGRISVIGFGSLLSERSARSTFPELKGFRVAALRGFRRVFAHAAPIFFERGIAIEATKESSSLSVEHCEGEMIVVTVFEIKEEEVPAFIERELEFRFLAVAPEGLDGAPFPNPAVRACILGLNF
ncbi:unnamed protein product [Triticum turgidum subsp. durum]|uniref:Uncharacterized protein n=1 Tax=Triticum turgidum subsp. durum TaxID=4567 RepID=A0A9R0QA75_TRITD|nr:unnamed protein product [Triticum turgidum subsp. durum]